MVNEILNDAMEKIKNLLNHNNNKLSIYNQIIERLEKEDILPKENINPLINIENLEDEGMINSSSNKTNSNPIYEVINEDDGQRLSTIKSTQYATNVSEYTNNNKTIDEIFQILCEVIYQDEDNGKEISLVPGGIPRALVLRQN